QLEAFGRAAEPVEPLQSLLACPGRVGQLLLGPSALGQQRLEPLLRLPATAGSPAPPCRELREPLLEPREIELRDARPQARDLDRELLGALGRGRLERERPEPLLDLRLDVTGALDLDRDPRELELGAMAARLEAAEPRRLLDQPPPPGSRRTSTGSGNDLKPRSLTARRCTAWHPKEATGRYWRLCWTSSRASGASSSACSPSGKISRIPRGSESSSSSVSRRRRSSQLVGL